MMVRNPKKTRWSSFVETIQAIFMKNVSHHKSRTYILSAGRPLLPSEMQDHSSSMQILDALTANNMQGQFENYHTALLMYLTFPVTVASNVLYQSYPSYINCLSVTIQY